MVAPSNFGIQLTRQLKNSQYIDSPLSNRSWRDIIKFVKIKYLQGGV